MKALITSIRAIGPDLKLFALASCERPLFPSYEPGAHIDVLTPAGVTRQYSLCGDPCDRRTQSILVKRQAASRGGSDSMHSLSSGQTLEIGQPRNAFALRDDPGKHLLFSAGVGITPIVSMAHALTASGRDFSWHHFAHASDFAQLHDALSLDKFDAALTVGTDQSRDQIARTIECALSANIACRSVYACGPAGFMAAVAKYSEQTLPDAIVRTEGFAPAPADPASRSFPVHLARSNKTLDVGQQETLLDALRRNGVVIASGCEQGVCGSCVIEVLEGTVLHNDEVLSDEERDGQRLMCPCVSRAQGRLTLNL
ncbi:MAG: oxidoreductase [Paraburkholderia sp.]|nr:MAG: oxidoreductase [Paraburkholderia sp.]